MLIVISPAKTLDYETPPVTEQFTQPDFLDQSQLLIERLRELSADDLSELMGISDKLAQLNWQRNMEWHQPFAPGNAKAAVLAFKGDVYEGLRASELSDDEFAFAQQHLRILSGLYGLLRPLDLMQAYRLEMGTKLDNERGANLYKFWGASIAEALNEQLDELGSDLLVNLASNEYFKAVDKKALQATIVTPVFKDYKSDRYKVVSFFAKKARGAMSRYLIEQRCQTVADIQQFDGLGYRFEPLMSSDKEMVFIRDEQ